MELLLGSEAELAQTGTELQDTLQVLLVCEEVERGQLKELPLLVDLANLAVNVLLNLLRLLVKLDQLAVADGVVVGVNAGAAADHVKDSVAALGGNIAKLVLVRGMATGDGLVGDFLEARCFNREWRLVHLVKRHDSRGVVHRDVTGGGSSTVEESSETSWSAV